MLVVNTILLSGGHNLPKALPQLRSCERAAHTGNVSELPFGQIGQKFSPQLKRISVRTDSVVRISRPQPASPVFQRLTCERRSKWRRRAWRGCT